jgi:hypothetical protein
MKLTRTKLRRLIVETLSENRSLASLFYKHAKQAGELEDKVVDYRTAEEHARENGKAYFIQSDDEVTELIRDESGKVNANIISKVPDSIDAQVFMSTYVNI